MRVLGVICMLLIAACSKVDEANVSVEISKLGFDTQKVKEPDLSAKIQAYTDKAGFHECKLSITSVMGDFKMEGKYLLEKKGGYFRVLNLLEVDENNTPEAIVAEETIKLAIDKFLHAVLPHP